MMEILLEVQHLTIAYPQNREVVRELNLCLKKGEKMCIRDRTYTGRIVAVPGDQVKITEEESLEINGSVVAESNIFYKTPAYEGAVTYPLTLSSGEYFVLGDFREGAKDSRYFGPIERKEIKGKVLVVLRRKEI